ncbi:MAG: cytochrome c3 family protein [Bacteroidota bacterium]
MVINVKTMLLIFFVLLLSASRGFAQKNEVCLDCHKDPDINTERNGKTVSLTVHPEMLAKSPHSKLKCVQCHQNFNPEAVPHKEKIEPVNCLNCHANAPAKHDFHPMGALTKNQSSSLPTFFNCKSCHGKHDITFPKNRGANMQIPKVTETCGNCHKSVLSELKLSEHYKAQVKKDVTPPNCVICHTNHVTKGFGLSPAELKANQEKLCLSCHRYEEGAKRVSPANMIKYETSNHGSKTLKGKNEAAGCVDCHGGHNLHKSEMLEPKVHKFKVPIICSKCHVAVSAEYKSSIHGISLLKKDMDTPGCTYCHGEHNPKPIPYVPDSFFEETKIKRDVVNKNKMIYCISCHSNEALMVKNGRKTIAQSHNWLQYREKHWEVLRCVDCHSSSDANYLSHNILPKSKTPRNCEDCHEQNSVMMTKLVKQKKIMSREKSGLIGGILNSTAYANGTTRNLFLEIVVFVIIGLSLFAVFFHTMLRIYFRRGGKK